jgi:hypothetical protein
VLGPFRMMTPTEIAHAWGMETTTFNVLLGVVLGASLAFIPQTLNWIYDSYQRRKERRLTAKRDVLLKAAEGAAYVADVIVSYYLGRTNWGDALKAAPGWMHKVHAVGSDATIKAFMDAHDCANEAIAELELLSYEISQKDLEYDSLSHWRNNLNDLYDKLKDPKYMENMPDRDQQTFQIMNNIMTSFGKQSSIAEGKAKLRRELMQRAAEWSSRYDTLVAAAMLEVRRELTFNKVSKQYRQNLEASSAKSRALFDRLMAEITKEDVAGAETVIEQTSPAGENGQS